MREIRSNIKRKQRKKSGGCMGRFLFLVILFSVVGFFGYQALERLGVQNYLLQMRYPLKYQTAVEKYAEEFQLEEALVYAVMHTESKFDPYAVSSAQAKGLMQLQDETAKECATALKLPSFTTDQLFEPEINIRLGCYYLKKLLQTYGQTETALAAYNGGPGNVNQWLKNTEFRKEQGGLSKIPFPETRRYVQKVIEAYRMYTRLYNLHEGVL